MHLHDMFHHFGRRAAHRGFGFGGRHGHHQRGGGRMFDHGDLRLVILALLAEKPRYGYDIIKELESRVGGDYSPSPGVVYPTLTLLEEVGHATVSDSQGGRKLYTLTAEGAAYVESAAPAIAVIMDRLKNGAVRRGPPGAVLRAMENLTMAVRMRVRGESLSESQIRAIADIIDGAVRQIEQV
jgi:DNA-binding PadR family transcriptional regulator